MEKYLKAHQYYVDLYDQFTVERCRRTEKIYGDIELSEKDEKEIAEGKQRNVKTAFLKMLMYFETGEEYVNKAKIINGWIERDKRYDKLYEEAKAPGNINCLSCGRLMYVESKHLDFAGEKDVERVMFFYDCPLKHKPMRVFYDDGEEYRIKRHACPKCDSAVDEKHKREKNVITTVYFCPKCGHVEQTDIDLSPTEEKIDPDFTRDRERFCLTDKAGAEYIEGKANIESFRKVIDESKEKEKNKDLYDKVAKLKKLKIIGLEKILCPVLESSNYVKLQFQTPQIGKDVFVPFIVYDAKEGRLDRDSTHELQKLLKKILADTNWRLMSEGVTYRLGMLEGRLRAYEREEDLLKLVI